MEKKRPCKIVIRLDRTQQPPTPHSIRPKEEERLRIFRSVIEILQLGEIPVAYAYSVPEQSSILGYMRREGEQAQLHDVPADKALSIEDRIRQLVQELRILTRPKECLRTDSEGYLQDGQLLLRYAPLIEWYDALEALGRHAGLDSDGGSNCVFPPVICLGGEELRIPALTLEEFRDRIKRIRKGQWPTEAVEDTEGGSASPTLGPGGGQPENSSVDEGDDSGYQSGNDNVKHRTATIRLSKMVPVAQADNGHFYRIPESIQNISLPAHVQVSRKIPRLASIYEISKAQITGITSELFGDCNEDDGEEG